MVKISPKEENWRLRSYSANAGILLKVKSENDLSQNKAISRRNRTEQSFYWRRTYLTLERKLRTEEKVTRKDLISKLKLDIMLKKKDKVTWSNIKIELSSDTDTLKRESNLHRCSEWVKN